MKQKHKSTKAGFKLAIELPVDQREIVEREAKQHGSAGNFIMSLIDKRNGPPSFREWLDLMPPEDADDNENHTAPVNITLTTDEWIVVKRAADANETTMDKVLSALLTTKHDTISTLFNSGYSLSPGPGD